MSTTTESKHTPGPWKLGPSPSGSLSEVYSDADSVYIADVPAIPPYGEANARLIATAPAMLEALEEMVAFGKRQGWAHVAIINAEAAIRLAKGESL